MAIITLCGSTKFKKEFEEWNIKLTLENNIVLSVVCFSHADNLEFTKKQKDIFDKIHLQKIDMSDEIFVIDVNGYIGKSTSKEIEYAWSKNKKVRYLSKMGEQDTSCYYCNINANKIVNGFIFVNVGGSKKWLCSDCASRILESHSSQLQKLQEAATEHNKALLDRKLEER
jgi:hypothetical protein